MPDDRDVSPDQRDRPSDRPADRPSDRLSDRPDRSWATSALGGEAYAALAERMPASEVWSLLLDVLERRASQRTPASLLRQWEQDGFTQPAAIDQRTLLALDAHLLAAASAFEAIELAPLAPLGACSRVSPTSQNKIVSALRGTEVVSDPTNVLALECARRLRADPTRVVRLATCHRCVRAQPIPNKPGFSRHFRIFCLAIGGREQRDQAFVTGALVSHIATHLAALDRLEQHGYAFADRRVTVLATPARAPLAERIVSALAAEGRREPVAHAPLDHAYYNGLRFMINVRNPQGDDLPLIDGGAFDWLEKLTTNRKLVFVASGMGSQLAASQFRLASSQAP